MKAYVKILYYAMIAVAFLIIALFYCHETTEEFSVHDQPGYEIFTGYEFVTYEDTDSPTGIVQEYRFTLTNVEEHNSAIAFYVSHQEVEVYLDNLLMYRLMSGKNNLFTSSTGYSWAEILISPEDEGKEVRILVYPVYESSIKKELSILIGDSNTIHSDILHRNNPILVLGIISILIGIGFLLFSAIHFRNLTVENNLAMLGIFSVFTGMWKITDMTSAPLIFGHPLVLSAMTLLSLPLMTASYVFFLRSQFAKERHKLVDRTGVVCTLVGILTMILQLTGLADLRETLFCIHVMIIVISLFLMTILIRELLQTHAKKLRITMLGCLICLVGVMVDMGIYYSTGYSDVAIFGHLSFMGYTVLMGYSSFKEALYLIKRGKEAARFEQLALHDELTGLYSRTYYSQYVEKHKSRSNDCFLIMLDVNNLKQCNDTFGHAYGDRLICNSAHLLEQAFLPDGRCIRMGGDEFCVIFRHSTEEEIKNYIVEFEHLVAKFNETHPLEFPIRVAYGYAQFDEKIDVSLNDTLQRADRKMYKTKRKMKQPEE